MSTPFQGASGPSGHAGSRPAFGQPAVSRNYAAPQPVLISLQQISPEQPVSHQLRKLTVRLLVDVFNAKSNKLPGDTSTPLKRYWHSMRYDLVPPTKHPPDPAEKDICDKGTVRRFAEMVG